MVVNIDVSLLRLLELLLPALALQLPLQLLLLLLLPHRGKSNYIGTYGRKCVCVSCHRWSALVLAAGPFPPETENIDDEIERDTGRESERESRKSGKINKTFGRRCRPNIRRPSSPSHRRLHHLT